MKRSKKEKLKILEATAMQAVASSSNWKVREHDKDYHSLQITVLHMASILLEIEDLEEMSARALTCILVEESRERLGDDITEEMVKNALSGDFSMSKKQKEELKESKGMLKEMLTGALSESKEKHANKGSSHIANQVNNILNKRKGT